MWTYHDGLPVRESDASVKKEILPMIYQSPISFFNLNGLLESYNSYRHFLSSCDRTTEYIRLSLSFRLSVKNDIVKNDIVTPVYLFLITTA